MDDRKDLKDDLKDLKDDPSACKHRGKKLGVDFLPESRIKKRNPFWVLLMSQLDCEMCCEIVECR